MTAPQDEIPRRRRPGPKPRGRTVAPLTITLNPGQRSALERLADARRMSISAVIRQYIDAGLAADAATGHGGDDAREPRVPAMEAVSTDSNDAARAPITIALIDDDPRIVAFATLVLEEAGYRVAAWSAAEGAGDFIAREMPAAMLVDEEMETRDAGQRVLGQMDADVSLRAIPVILTATRTRHTPEGPDRREHPSHYTLAKPYTAAALIAVVEQAVAAESHRRAIRS